MSFYSELKRRKVIKVAITYAAGAWIIAQVADLVIDNVGAPDWIIKAVLFLLLIGFPVALIFSWAYEVTPEGIRLDTPEDSESEAVAPSPPAPRSAKRMAIAWTSGIFVIISLVAGVGLNVGGLRDWMIGGVMGPITSIAVLPLDNLSGDPEQEYFTDGMTEALTAELAQINALKVISRTSAMRYKNTDKLLPEIARELGVDALLEGSVLRAGDEVRITLQLVHGPTDRHLWARNFQRDLRDILALQAEVARAIADEIKITLTPQAEMRLARTRTVDPKAYQLWLKGNFHLSKLDEESSRKALASYQKAIDQVPDYAPAHAGLAWAYISLGSWYAAEPPRKVFPLAKESAERALALDPALAEAHLALARILELFDWDWAGAEHAYKQGIALNPSTTFGRMHFADFLFHMGRFEESIEFARQTLELDPLSPAAYNGVAFPLMFLAGRDEEALEFFREGLEIDPDFPQSHFALSEFYLMRGEFDNALSHLAQFVRVEQTPSTSTLGLAGRVYSLAGRHAEARATLSELMERRAQAYVRPSALVEIFVGLGEFEEALRWLEVAYEERDIGLVWLKEGWVFDRLRSDPQFQVILERMNFPGP
jgi:TolB-like protein/thioredoxin-like negative regulator of GroEL